MVDRTEQKFLDAALKLFAEYGYKGATTRSIADKAGFNELTLFRKFKNKKNLFDRVLFSKQEDVLEKFNLILLDDDFEDPRDFFGALICHLIKLMEENYDYVKLFLNEKTQMSESVIEKFINHLGEHIEKKFPNDKIDYKVLSFDIFSFVYFIVFDKLQGRTFLDHKKTIFKFIDHQVLLIQS